MSIICNKTLLFTADIVTWKIKKDNITCWYSRWQYFGSNNGLYRMYPGREWQTNFVGFYEDYDPRVRPWYIAATSGQKDVIIVIDCSRSMAGKKFSMAKSIAITVLNTLTKQDYVNVICGQEPYYDAVGKCVFIYSFPWNVSNCFDLLTFLKRQNIQKRRLESAFACGIDKL